MTKPDDATAKNFKLTARVLMILVVIMFLFSISLYLASQTFAEDHSDRLYRAGRHLYPALDGFSPVFHSVQKKMIFSSVPIMVCFFMALFAWRGPRPRDVIAMSYRQTLQVVLLYVPAISWFCWYLIFGTYFPEAPFTRGEKIFNLLLKTEVGSSMLSTLLATVISVLLYIIPVLVFATVKQVLSTEKPAR